MEVAHSVYLETLGELGAIGLVLVLVAVGTVVLGLLLRSRGSIRGVGAGLLGAAVAWALHTGIDWDWDWEMPATTVWFFALGGLALAAPVAHGDEGHNGEDGDGKPLAVPPLGDCPHSCASSSRWHSCCWQSSPDASLSPPAR